MNLYLMRHCEPVPGHPNNADRPLTEDGLKQAADMGAWLAGHIGRVDIVIHSPFLRAYQTAQAMGKALGAHLADTRMLAPDGKPVEMWDEIERLAQASKDVLVIGHDPSINKLLFWVCGEDIKPEKDVGVEFVRFDWGAIANIAARVPNEDSDPVGVLKWLVTPEIVLASQEIIEAAKAVSEALNGAER